MADEERELLARIGQLAGQINRHKNQQAGLSSLPGRNHVPPHRNTYRHASAPYQHHSRGYRSYPPGPPRSHRHRTLQLNSTTTPSPATSSPSGSTPEPSGWVSKVDRHRQLINADVYDREKQARAKAIEQTHQRKMQERRRWEKNQITHFSGLQGGTDATASKPTEPEIVVSGIRFKVLPGGNKLARFPDDPNPASATPKTAIVNTVKFHRTKTGNLVASRIVQNQRRSGVIKKVGERCKAFSTTGSCTKGPMCRYLHIPDKVAICREFLKDGNCSLGASCDLSHDARAERVPNCLHHAKGNCTNADCVFTHSKAAAGAPVCKDFGYYGYCDRGAACTERHVYECPDFSNTGQCRNKGCKLLHRERASVLRNQAKADAMIEDISSDEEPADSDDVDSDEVTEFIEADDNSDFENPKEFLAI